MLFVIFFGTGILQGEYMKPHKQSIIFTLTTLAIILSTLFLIGFASYTLYTCVQNSKQNNRQLQTVNAGECSHSFGLWKEYVLPSESVAGSLTRVCSICKLEETDILPVLDTHNGYFKKVVYEPTCTTDGQAVYSIDMHNQTFEITTTIKSVGHDYEENGVVLLEPTCVDFGVKYLPCKKCADKSNTAQIAPLGHDISCHTGKPATCVENGYENYVTCNRCEYSTFKSISPLGHNKIYHTKKDATCLTSGWKEYYTCSNCDYSSKEEIAPLGHNFEKLIIVNNPTKTHYENLEFFDISGATAILTCSHYNCTGESVDIEKLFYTKKPLTINDESVKVYTIVNGKTYWAEINITIQKNNIFVEDEAFPSFYGIYDGKVHSLKIDYTKIHTDNNAPFEVLFSNDNITWQKDKIFSSRDVISQKIYWKVQAQNCKTQFGQMTFEIAKAHANIVLENTSLTFVYGDNYFLPKAYSNFGVVYSDMCVTDIVSAGKYVVNFVVDDTNNYYGDSQSAEITVLTKKVTSQEDYSIVAEVDTSEGVDPSAKLIIKEVTNYKNYDNLPEGKIISTSYSALLLVNNTPTNIKQSMIIKFKKPENLKTNSTCTIIMEENGNMVEKIANIYGDFVIFETSTLGDFSIVIDQESNNQDLFLVKIILVVSVVVLFATIICIAIKFRKKKLHK